MKGHISMKKMNEEYKYEVSEGRVRILRCFVKGGNILIPREIDGMPVTDIGAYAFSSHGEKTEGNEEVCGEKLIEILLPDTIERIGRYAFYGCSQLGRIEFYSSIKDIGAGAFTGCHRVRELKVTIVKGIRSCLRELLMELREKQHVVYVSEEGQADLIFPEFFEEAVENTPARILETHTHGSGIWYRNCFVQTELQFEMYDNRFPWAKEDEKTEVALQMAFGRLLYPLKLNEKSKERYEKFISEILNEAGKWIIKSQNMGALSYLAEHIINSKEEFDQLIEIAKEENDVAAISMLMDRKHIRFREVKQKKTRFEL